jgi:predicted regulator of Ras-like GTPase activity (Roadblock/LC7/MglB family)
MNTIPAGASTNGSSQGLSAQARDFNWLLSRFSEETAGVIDVIAVSSDGLLMAVAGNSDRATSDRLSAIVSGISSLAAGAASTHQLGGLNKVIVDMEGGYLIVMSISVGALLGVVASKNTSLGNVAYEMTVFANRSSAILSPQLINELKNTVDL